jgi:hypothetical protein
MSAGPIRQADADTGAAFAAVITGLRQHSTPYHLAHGLIDHAQYLVGVGDNQAAAADEAHDLAQRMRGQPLLDRAETAQPASRTPAP